MRELLSASLYAEHDIFPRNPLVVSNSQKRAEKKSMINGEGNNFVDNLLLLLSLMRLKNFIQQEAHYETFYERL